MNKSTHHNLCTVKILVLIVGPILAHFINYNASSSPVDLNSDSALSILSTILPKTFSIFPFISSEGWRIVVEIRCSGSRRSYGGVERGVSRDLGTPWMEFPAVLVGRWWGRPTPLDPTWVRHCSSVRATGKAAAAARLSVPAARHCS